MKWPYQPFQQSVSRLSFLNHICSCPVFSLKIFLVPILHLEEKKFKPLLVPFRVQNSVGPNSFLVLLRLCPLSFPPMYPETCCSTRMPLPLYLFPLLGEILLIFLAPSQKWPLRRTFLMLATFVVLPALALIPPTLNFDSTAFIEPTEYRLYLNITCTIIYCIIIIQCRVSFVRLSVL